jgi:hypothetical protein
LRKYWCLPGWAAAFLAVGVPYWAIPYNKVSLPDSVLGAGLLVVIAIAALARAYLGRPFWRVVAVMGTVIPAVVMVRVMVDCSRDPTAHNLWPFEVFIAVFVGGGAALAGSVLGTLILLLFRGKRPGT